MRSAMSTAMSLLRLCSVQQAAPSRSPLLSLSTFTGAPALHPPGPRRWYARRSGRGSWVAPQAGRRNIFLDPREVQEGASFEVSRGVCVCVGRAGAGVRVALCCGAGRHSCAYRTANCLRSSRLQVTQAEHALRSHARAHRCPNRPAQGLYDSSRFNDDDSDDEEGALQPQQGAAEEGTSAAAGAAGAAGSGGVALPRARGSTKVRSAEFVKSSVSVKDCPKAGYPEFAVIGRSNVGKSSLINLLTGRRSLAMVSKTPGGQPGAGSASLASGAVPLAWLLLLLLCVQAH